MTPPVRVLRPHRCLVPLDPMEYRTLALCTECGRWRYQSFDDTWVLVRWYHFRLRAVIRKDAR